MSRDAKGPALEAADAEIAWRELLAAVGGDIAGPLTDALERIHAMTTSGHIDRDSLRALRAAVEEARQVGLTAQQLVRYASRRIRLSHERLQLTDLLREVLRHREREAGARGLSLGSARFGKMKAAEVLADGSLLFSLLNTVVDWALRHARSDLEFGVDMTTWPAHARLSCSFDFRGGDGAEAALSEQSLDSLTWRLLEQIAKTMDLIMARRADGDRVTLTMEFTRTANESMEGVSSVELSDGTATTPNSMPLVGSHVLIVASRRAVRMQIRDALHHMGLVIDLVSSVEEAIDFCKDALPHAMIVEGILESEGLARLRTEIWAEVPSFAFIQIVEEGTAFEMSDTGTGQIARVGRDAIDTALSAVLLFELSKAL
jgi:hypothetical protein